jgi:aspartyl/asparaginyl beta-hydroxylase (cupin superfamily)
MALSPAPSGAHAADALQRGDFATARRLFGAIIDAGRSDASVHLGLALSALGAGDAAAASAAADQTLAREPSNLRATLVKADALEALGQSRAAMTYYSAVATLAPDPDRFPPAAAMEIRRAMAARDRLNGAFEDHIRGHLSGLGLNPVRDSGRFADSLDMVMGRRQRHEQQPRAYYLPELPAITFFPRTRFDWIERLEAATRAIRAEAEAMLADPANFAPYIEAEAERAAVRPGPVANRNLGKDDWSACYLLKDGARVEANAARCPATLAALDGLPLEQVPGRAPFALFSVLKPGAWIAPHHGFLNTRLVVHLPLIVPDGCWFRVGGDVRLWEEGKAWAFDDTIEHEARNQGTGVRTILIFNIWRPDLTDIEKRLISGLFEAIDSFGASA